MVIVSLLSVVYILVRRDYSATLDYVGNPARFLVKDEAWDLSDPKAMWADDGFLVVEDPGDPVSVELRDAVEFALDCLAQRPRYVTQPTQEQIAEAKQGIIVTTTFLDKIESLELLLDYAQNGGNLIFAIRPEVNHSFMSIHQQLGIIEHGFFYSSEGFHLREGYLTAEPFNVEGPWLNNSVIQLHVGSDCDVKAVNDDGVAMIWIRKYGAGSILFMNNSLMTYKSTGGLMTALIADLQGPTLYPVINARAFALEAFPLPADVNREVLRSMYLRAGSSFLRDVWWPDMVQFYYSHRIPYTAGILTGYVSEAPYASSEVAGEELDLIFYTKELARYDGELGFTGFNQKPLYFSVPPEQMTFEPWADPSTARVRTSEVFSMLSVFLPDYDLYAYLPPERLLDEEGRRVIAETMPNLQVICGDLYDRTLWYQDFGVDKDGIVRMPVVTSGFDNGPETGWNLLCAAAAKGIVFHSCDVSDLLLETDPSHDWGALSRGFFKFGEDYVRATGYLEGMTVTQAAFRVREMTALNPRITYRWDAVDVSCTLIGEQGFFILLCPGLQPVPAENVSCTKIFDGRYLITTAVEQFSLELINA